VSENLRGNFTGFRIDVLTLFPGMFVGPLEASIIGRAQREQRVEIYIHNLRDYTHDKHKTVDDRPFGGGPGMLLKPEPIFEAVEKLATETTRVILVSPSGVLYTQAHAWRLTQYGHLLIICGAYEGVDERVRICLADEVFSIGDYVLTNGALPAMVIIDSVVRLLPGVLGDDQSAESESFANGILEYPHYTRPAVFRRMAVPEVLLSGNHAAIQKWRFQEAIRRTREYRPDLYQRFLANHEKDKWSGPGDKHAK